MHLIRFYSGFTSFEVLQAFFEFLGPEVNGLKYWGMDAKTRRRRMKLDPFNQFFLTLMKLRLNLREQDLGTGSEFQQKYALRLGHQYIPICFYYRLIRLASISIYKYCTSYLQALCSNRYPGYGRILNNTHQTYG